MDSCRWADVEYKSVFHSGLETNLPEAVHGLLNGDNDLSPRYTNGPRPVTETRSMQTEIGTHAETGTQTEVRTYTETRMQTETKTHAEIGTQTEVRTHSEAGMQTETRTHSEIGTQTAVRRHSEAEMQTEIETQSETETHQPPSNKTQTPRQPPDMRPSKTPQPGSCTGQNVADNVPPLQRSRLFTQPSLVDPLSAIFTGVGGFRSFTVQLTGNVASYASYARGETPNSRCSRPPVARPTPVQYVEDLKIVSQGSSLSILVQMHFDGFYDNMPRGVERTKLIKLLVSGYLLPLLQTPDSGFEGSLPPPGRHANTPFHFSPAPFPHEIQKLRSCVKSSIFG